MKASRWVKQADNRVAQVRRGLLQHTVADSGAEAGLGCGVLAGMPRSDAGCKPGHQPRAAHQVAVEIMLFSWDRPQSQIAESYEHLGEHIGSHVYCSGALYPVWWLASTEAGPTEAR